jgi:hypothetical protein
MFAPAYMGRERWAKPYDRFYHSTRKSRRDGESSPGYDGKMPLQEDILNEGHGFSHTKLGLMRAFSP